jgi:hypothetical protein
LVSRLTFPGFAAHRELPARVRQVSPLEAATHADERLPAADGQRAMVRRAYEMLHTAPVRDAFDLEAYRRVINGTDDGRDTWRRLRSMNQLVVTRGTLRIV